MLHKRVYNLLRDYPWKRNERMLLIFSGGSCAGNGLPATVALSHMKNLVTGWLGLCILALCLLQHPTEYIHLRYSHNLERVPKFPDLISSLVGPAGGQGFGLRCSADCNADGGACIFHPGPWQERCFREEKPAGNALFTSS